MVTFKKILVPTDFSKGAEGAYSVSQKIADTFGGTIDFINVIPTLKYFSESLKGLGVPLDMNKDIYPRIQEESEHKLKKGMDQYLKEKNKGKYFAKIDRRPSDTIAKFAAENNYDLIVMGAKGKHETSMVRGGTAERVIRKSQVPVFSVDDRFEFSKIKNVVMTTDSSTLSFSAFPMALAMADTFNANLTLFHVVELFGSASEDIQRKPDKGEMLSIYEAIIERLNKYLISRGMEHIHVQQTGVTYEDEVIITDGENSRSVPLFTKIEKAVSAHYEIENYTTESADLVVMATHGHSGFAHLILGSTAEKIAQYVKKPVITIRPGKDHFNK